MNRRWFLALLGFAAAAPAAIAAARIDRGVPETMWDGGPWEWGTMEETSHGLYGESHWDTAYRSMQTSAPGYVVEIQSVRCPVEYQRRVHADFMSVRKAIEAAGAPSQLDLFG
jgi:hypothetical protein